MTVDERINFAKEAIKAPYPTNFNKIYPFTTENLKGYMSMYDFQEKSALTVGSSCDQIFNLYLYGAADVVCFDINPLTEDFFYLKKAAFKCLSYEEFVYFFSLYVSMFYGFNRFAFNEKDMAKVLDYIEGDSLYFWTRLFEKYPFKKVRKNLFTADEVNVNAVKHVNAYLSEENYYLFKSKIDSITPEFIVSDIKNVNYFLDRKFDFIMLSNIAAFISRIFDNSLFKFKNCVVNLSEFLNDGGVMFFAYLYDFNRNTIPKEHWDIINHLDKVFYTFRDLNIGYETIEGMKSLINKKNNSTDLVLTYRK